MSEPLVAERDGRQRALLYAAAAAFGVLFFHVVIGLSVVIPTNIDWLMTRGDGAAHYVAWSWLRQTPPSLSIPLGALPGFGWPTMATVAGSDAIPLLALPLWPLSSWLPSDAQYFGAWLLACYVLQALFGAALSWRVRGEMSFALAGTALFLCAPFFLARWTFPTLGHAALSAHWLLLAALLLVVSEARSRRLDHAAHAALPLVACFVHPFLALLVLALLGASIARRAMETPAGQRIRLVLSYLLPTGLTTTIALSLLGWLGRGSDVAAGGFGLYHADLLAFANPQGRSTFLPGFDGDITEEGFAYLGAGALLLLVCALLSARETPSRLRRPLGVTLLPAWLVAGALFVVSLSSFVRIGGVIWFELVAVYEPFRPLLDPFRVSGRLAWPLAYLLLFWGLAVIAHAPGPRARRMVVLCAFLQLVDVTPGFFRTTPTELEDWRPTLAQELRGAGEHYERILFLPPEFRLVRCRLPDAPPVRCMPYAWWAAREGMEITCSADARPERQRVRELCQSVLGRLSAEGPLTEELVIAPRPLVERLQASSAPLRCAAFGEVGACVHHDNDDPISRRLDDVMR